MSVPDPAKPWAEKSITLDAFGYHGVNVFDNGTGATTGGITAGGVNVGGTTAVVLQRDSFDVAGLTLRAQYDSLVFNAGGQYEWHSHPYAGTPGMSGATTPAGAGVPNGTSSKGFVSWGELDYVIWPWFVPGVRTEYTLGSVDGASSFSLLRVIPGIAMLVRPDVRVILTGDFETATGIPPAGTWSPAGGATVPLASGQQTTFQAETITATAALAF